MIVQFWISARGILINIFELRDFLLLVLQKKIVKIFSIPNQVLYHFGIVGPNAIT